VCHEADGHRRDRENSRGLTRQQDRVIRQQVIEHLTRQMHYDAEFRREEATSAVSSHAKQ
jgi:hypothetical protein